MKKNNGMTFIEVLIAIVITGIVLSSMLACLNFAYRYAQHNANKTMALNFAGDLMEEIKSKPYDDAHATDANYHTGAYTNFLGPEMAENTPYTDDDDDNNPQNGTIIKNEFDDVDDYNGYTDTVNLFQNEDVSISAVRTVVIKDQNGSSVLDTAAYLNIAYKQITVTVSWTWLGHNYSETGDRRPESVSTIVTYWKNEV